MRGRRVGPRPPRWWFHRHRVSLSGWVYGEFMERCCCGAGRFAPRQTWTRLDPWP